LSVDSTKLLAEKLSLVRELATLKPELEYLRTQATYQQTVLADKLALQRQVNTLEVELETQKRASKRAAYKEVDDEKGDELYREVVELRKELSQEKRERERAQKALEKVSNEWETRMSALESKAQQLRTKLRETKDKLKESQAELAQAEAAVTKPVTASLAGEFISFRKRNANQISADATIGTPDGVAGRGKRHVARKGKLDQTVLGEKSMFSITPFLNRTISIAPESPLHKPDPKIADEQEMEQESPLVSEEKKQPEVERKTLDTQSSATQKQRPTKTTEIGALKVAKEGIINAKSPNRKLREFGILEKVTENDDENLESDLPAVAIGSI
jgi:hypothetical protein